VSIDIQPVRPGDLIAASFANEIIDALTALDERLTALEAEGTTSPPPPATSIAITSVTPSTVTEGDVVTIAGSGFGSTLGDSNVTFAGVPTTQIQSFSDTTIVCKVPGIPALDVPSPPSSVSVSVQVSNFVTSASRFITVQPRVVAIAGSLEVVYQDASPDPLTAGQANDFQFLLTSNASQSTTVTLAPTLTGAAWPVSLLDGSKQPLTGGAITLASGANATFFVRVAVPTGTNGTAFQVGVAGSTPGLATASSGNQDFTVGQFADPDESFTLSPTTTTPSGALSGTTLSAKVNQEVDVNFDAEFTLADNYTVTLALVPSGASGWTTDIGTPAPNPSGAHVIPVTSADLANAAGGHVPKTITIAVLAAAAATNAQMRVVVKGANATASRTFTFDLHPHA